jgi:hypothetical protein
MEKPTQLRQTPAPTAAQYDNNLFNIPDPNAIAAAEKQAIQARNYNQAVQEAEFSPAQRLQVQLTGLRQDAGQAVTKAFGGGGESAAVMGARAKAQKLMAIAQGTASIQNPLERLKAIYSSLNEQGLPNEAEAVRQKIMDAEKHQQDLAASGAEVKNKNAGTTKLELEAAPEERLRQSLGTAGYPQPVIEKALANFRASGGKTTGDATVDQALRGESQYSAPKPLIDPTTKQVVIEDGKPIYVREVISGPNKGKQEQVAAPGTKITNNNNGSISNTREVDAFDKKLKLAEYTDKNLESVVKSKAAVELGMEQVREGQRTGNIQMQNDGLTLMGRGIAEYGASNQSSAGERAEALKSVGLLNRARESVSKLVTGTNTDAYTKDALDRSQLMLGTMGNTVQRRTAEIQSNLLDTGVSGAVITGAGLGQDKDKVATSPRTSTNPKDARVMGPNGMKALNDKRAVTDKPDGQLVSPKGGLPYILRPDGSREYK